MFFGIHLFKSTFLVVVTWSRENDEEPGDDDAQQLLQIPHRLVSQNSFLKPLSWPSFRLSTGCHTGVLV